MIEGPRAARASELPSVIQLANEVFRPAGIDDMGAAFPTLFSPANLVNLRLCLEAGGPVSLVGQTVRDFALGSARVRVTCIGSVCTLESHRGQGLASKLMDDAIAAARSQGAVLAFISGGRGLYRRMGCIDAGLFQSVTAEESSRVSDLRCEVRPWAPEDVPAMCALRGMESVRFIRGAEETGMLLSAGHVHAIRGKTWVVEVKGKLAAWFSASFPEPGKAPTLLKVREIAGSRLAVLAALPAALRESGLHSAEVTAPVADRELAVLAEAYALPARLRGFEGTIKIIDAPGLLGALQGWIEERAGGVSAEGGSTPAARFSLGPESIVVEKAEDLAALLFGSVERPARAMPPGPLARLLSRTFPVPLPMYGLNYI